MGVFSFIKDAGARVFGTGQTNTEDKVEAITAANQKAMAHKLEIEEAAAKELEAIIKDLKLEVEDLKVKIEDDMAIVTGHAHDQSTKEKVVLVIGNTSGIASVDDQMNVDHAEHESQFHTVIKGETLGEIAKQYYGTAIKHPLIFDANKPMLSHPDKIYTGQVLRIPSLR